MENNGPLIALAFLKRVEPAIKLDKRAQLDRTGVTEAKDCIVNAMNRLDNAGIRDFYIMAYLNSAVEYIESVLEDETFVETDTVFKKVVMDKINEAINLLYVPIGTYYMDNEFVFKDAMRPILNELIDNCISRGMYFGYDKQSMEV